MKKLIAILVLICQLSLNVGLGQRAEGRKIAKMFRSKNPDQVQQSIQELSAGAKDKENFHKSILYTMLLGEQYVRSGDYAKGEQALTEAYEESKKHIPQKRNTRFKLAHFGNFQVTIFDPADRLAYFYLNIGNTHSAENLFQESKKRRDLFFSRRSIHRVHPVVGLGSVSYRKGDLVKTYDQFNEASRMISHAMTSNYDYDILKRLYLHDLAEICMSLGKQDQALRYINQLAIASSGANKFNSRIGSLTETARIFELKARYYLLAGDFDKAKYFLDRADYYNPVQAGISDVKFKLLKTRGQLAWYQNKPSEAAERFIELVKEYRQFIAQNFIAMSEYEKEQFYASLKKDFDIFNAFTLDQQGQSSAALLDQEMYNNVLNTKALLLNESNRQKNQIMASGDQALIDKLNKWEHAKATLSAEYYEPTSQEKIGSLEHEIEQLEKELNAASGLFSSNINPHAWSDISKLLQPGEAAAEILRIRVADKKLPDILSDSVVYAVLLVKAGSSAPALFTLQNGNQLETHFLPYYRNAVLSRLNDSLSYRQFWLPIKRELEGIQKLYLSPDGVYNQINLNTLQNPTSGKYLIDEIELTYLTNTSDLTKNRKEGNTGKAILVGRPSYDLENVKTLKIESAYGQRNVISEELQSFKDQEFIDLPGTEKEINLIKPILETHHLSVNVYLDDDATEENVKTIHSPAILHIATHGFFVSDGASSISPMIRSGLVLAGVRNRSENGSQEDGILTAYEATNLDLQSTDLVVLSACETGMGEVRNGEGVYGLQRAIVVGGANNLIMSLWKVDDDATAELMRSFYSAWSGKNNTGEFRKAQIALRQKYPHPFFWGAFIMLGK